MGRIKSAIELAMERTQDVESDRTSLRKHEARTEGKRLFARARADSSFDLKGQINAASKEEKAWVRDGLYEAAVANISLPVGEFNGDEYSFLERVFDELVRERNKARTVLEQLRSMLAQYTEDRNRLVDELRRRFEPRLQQREQQLSQQAGRPVRIDPASDPEFAKVLQENMAQLDAHYRSAVEQGKQQLEALFQRGT